MVNVECVRMILRQHRHESLFRTCKYRPDYPGAFASLKQARAWALSFERWYNHEHKHSGLALLPPEVVHSGRAEEVLAKLDAPWVTALALRPDGSLIAGTTPDARVFVVDPKGAVRQTEIGDREYIKPPQCKDQEHFRAPGTEAVKRGNRLVYRVIVHLLQQVAHKDRVNNTTAAQIARRN